MNHLTIMGWFHLAFAAFGLVAGAVQLLRRKDDRQHDRFGIDPAQLAARIAAC